MVFLNNLSEIDLIYFSISISILFILNFNVIINIIFGPFLKGFNKPEKYPLVSVLIPARNESKNIRNCLDSILNQDYPTFEVILLDDNSIDNTYKIACEFLSYKSFKLLKGKSLEDGWLGKNFACYQLFEAAKGDILIFTDADNTYHPTAISKTVHSIEKHKLGMISAFPQQITNSFSEKLIIPLIDLIVYSGLILWSTLKVKLKIFAAANGQWIAFTREAYQQIGGHRAIKNHIVEDVAFSRLAKSLNINMLTVAGKGIVFGKMYSNFKEIWNGLSKNIYGLSDFKPLPFFILLFLIFLTTILPFFLIFNSYLYPIAILLVILNLIWRLSLSIAFKHNILISVILHPLSMIMLIAIGINSFYKSTYSNVVWKDRKIKINQ